MRINEHRSAVLIALLSLIIVGFIPATFLRVLENVQYSHPRFQVVQKQSLLEAFLQLVSVHASTGQRYFRVDGAYLGNPRGTPPFCIETPDQNLLLCTAAENDSECRLYLITGKPTSHPPFVVVPSNTMATYFGATEAMHFPERYSVSTIGPSEYVLFHAFQFHPKLDECWHIDWVAGIAKRCPK